MENQTKILRDALTKGNVPYFCKDESEDGTRHMHTWWQLDGVSVSYIEHEREGYSSDSLIYSATKYDELLGADYVIERLGL